MTISKRDLFWGVSAQGLGIALWLVMLPVVLRYLPPVEVGLWLVFNTIAGLAQLLELGFQPTLARNVSYVYAGAQDLYHTGLQPGCSADINKQLLATLLAASRRIYGLVALSAAVLLWLGGTAYLHGLTPNGQAFLGVLLSWMTFSAGYIINFYYGYLNAFLQGRGDMVQANKVIAISKVTQLLIGVILIMGGAGLIGLGLASLLSTIVSRIMAHRYVYTKDRSEIQEISASKTEVRRITAVIWHNSGRYGLVLIGAFLITRANILIAASRVGLIESTGYALGIQIMIVMQTLATLPFNLNLPRLNMLRAMGETDETYRVFSTSVATAIMLFGLGAVAFILAGPLLLHSLGRGTILPGTSLLVVLAMVFLLEINHGICANFIATGNHVPFVSAAVVTGLCIVVGSWVLAKPYGVGGLVVSTACCQLAYNNWKWPHEVALLLNKGYLSIIRDGLFHFKNNYT